jgi:hypothetical protein
MYPSSLIVLYVLWDNTHVHVYISLIILFPIRWCNAYENSNKVLWRGYSHHPLSCRWGNWGLEGVSALPKAIQLVAKIQAIQGHSLLCYTLLMLTVGI